MDKLDIVNLIESNPITKLSSDYNVKLLNFQFFVFIKKTCYSTRLLKSFSKELMSSIQARPFSAQEVCTLRSIQ